MIDFGHVTVAPEHFVTVVTSHQPHVRHALTPAVQLSLVSRRGMALYCWFVLPMISRVVDYYSRYGMQQITCHQAGLTWNNFRVRQVALLPCGLCIWEQIPREFDGSRHSIRLASRGNIA